MYPPPPPPGNAPPGSHTSTPQASPAKAAAETPKTPDVSTPGTGEHQETPGSTDYTKTPAVTV